MGNGCPSLLRTRKVNPFQAKCPLLYQIFLTSCTSWCRIAKRFEKKRNISMKLVKENKSMKNYSNILVMLFFSLSIDKLSKNVFTNCCIIASTS